MQCTRCGAEVASGSRFCAICGQPVPPDPIQAAVPAPCPFCGEPLAAGSRFCNACGRPTPASAEQPLRLQPIPPPTAPPPMAWGPPPTTRRSSPRWLPALLGVVAGILLVGTVALALVADLRAALFPALAGDEGTPAPLSVGGEATSLPTSLPAGVAELLPALLATDTSLPPSPPPATTAPVVAPSSTPVTTSAPAATSASAATSTEETTFTEEATPTPEATSAPAVASTDTPPPVPTATSEPATTSAPAAPGVVLSFEQDREWRRGDQPHGEFTRSGDQTKSGAFSGRLTYAFPAVSDNYVVFLARPAVALAGVPTGLTTWVYGDGSSHFLNAWVQDAAGEVRQYTFGRVAHQGWAQLTAWFDEAHGWPNGHISGSDNARLDYPIALYALLVDGVPDGQASSGAIYLDDVATTAAAIVAQATSAPAAPTAAPVPQGPVEVVFEYAWDGGWMGVENQGVWAAAGDGHQYVAEVGFLSSPEALAALRAVPASGWRGKVIVRKQVGWVSCTTEVCQEHSSDGAQKLVSNQIYLRPEAWSSLVNSYLAGGWAAVTQNAHYQTVQQKAFQPIGAVPSIPVIGFRFTQIE